MTGMGTFARTMALAALLSQWRRPPASLGVARFVAAAELALTAFEVMTSCIQVRHSVSRNLGSATFFSMREGHAGPWAVHVLLHFH